MGYTIVDIDTAAIYEHEKDIGKAPIKSGTHREEVFVTNNVWNSNHSYNPTIAA